MSSDDERERIRERKKEQLKKQLGEADPAEEGNTTSEGTPSTPIHIDGSGEFEEVVESNRVVLVDCYADWCGPCQMMEPTIDALAAETDAAVAKVDVDANQRLAGQLGAQSIPTLLLYVDGEPVERLVGAKDRGTLESLIAQYR
ncbi:thioredoxin [Natranaeroarchaeum sulfidigenes]|uniref:Thiol-disulfide isomerase or thioredoxin n=1 Tax=Natranaeroarchaeum sulfidigenes TaxID=2784880 RepID=A0A897MPQ6_9EURY|nr:thioredoxin [Natranaeroarchaeum sulfidigenes]QSG02547.1 Thiol-disulfide isomerase or thioredoxin [Natranaeroarchaeum sulfidigenes]